MSTATPPTPYVLVQLQSGEPDYENISREFLKDNIKVAKIERLENRSLSDRFSSELEELKNHTPDFSLNIRPLYHCACIEKSRICEEGLGQTMSRTGDFGIGFYFSDSPIKCLHYPEFANHPERAMILVCLVVLGDCKIYEPGCFDPSLTKAPEKETLSSGSRYYDSVMGSRSGFNQYVVYQNQRVKVNYIITFAVDEETKESIQSMAMAEISCQADEKSKASDSNSKVDEETEESIQPMTQSDMSSQSDEKSKASDSNSKAWKYVAVGLGAGALGFVATPLIAVAGLGTVGFTAGGVAAGSTAAAIQATIGNVAAGSAFAMAQSAAATGAVSVGTQLVGGTISGAASAAVMKLFKSKTHKEDVAQEK